MVVFKHFYIGAIIISLVSARFQSDEGSERRNQPSRKDGRRDPSKLPPKFEASKYGFAEGDKVDVNKANTVQLEAESKGERAPNFFKVTEDEVLLLPEIFSTLEMEKVKRDFAKEGDTADELELRNSRWWGRLYIDGWPQTVQYLRAHFGEPPPVGSHKILVADPIDACTTMDKDTFAGAIVLARRGVCTFSAKARIAAKANVAAIILVNNEDGNDHLAGPDAHDVGISVSMVAKVDGELVLGAIQKRMSASGPLKGSMIPIHCAERSETLKGAIGSDLCAPTTASDRTFAKRPVEGGLFQVGRNQQKHEFMIATFGVVVDPSVNYDLMLSDPPTGCQLLKGGGDLTFEQFIEVSRDNATKEEQEAAANSVYKGKAVIVERGGCAFIDKAKTLQAAGAALIVVINTETSLSRFGVEPRWKGLVINIPVLMVTDVGGALLKANLQEKVTFALSRDVTAEAWSAITESRSAGSAAAIEKQLKEHKAWPDRVAALGTGAKSDL